jgi:hypothetical protein
MIRDFATGSGHSFSYSGTQLRSDLSVVVKG